jgi:hypothetical protein
MLSFFFPGQRVAIGSGPGHLYRSCVCQKPSVRWRFYRLQPDEVRVELVAAWKKETPSVALGAFLDLVDARPRRFGRKLKFTERYGLSNLVRHGLSARKTSTVSEGSGRIV